MALSIISIILLIGFIYRNESRPEDKNRSFFYQKRKLFALLGIAIIPIVLANIFIPVERIETLDEKIRYGIKDDDPNMVYEAYRDKKDRYPDSTEIQVKYMEAWMEARSHYTCNWMVDEYEENEYINSDVCKVFAEYYFCKGGIDIATLDSTYQDQKFLSLLKSIYFRDIGELDSAEYYAVKEINKNPEFERTYDLLISIYSFTSHDKLDSLMRDWSAFNKIDFHYRTSYYFDNIMPFRFVVSHYTNSIKNAYWFAFVATFAVSLLWLFFLRISKRTDKLSWGWMILIFVLGALFTDFCHFFYHYAHHKLYFFKNGDLLNDFMYTWIVNAGGEEFVKFLPWILVGLFSKKLKDPRNYILFASIAGLGFAFNENLSYFNHEFNITSRTVSITFGHMFFAATVAYSFVLMKFKYFHWRFKYVIPVIGFVLAAFFHALWNYLLYLEGIFYVLWYILVIAYIWGWFYYRKKAQGFANVPTIMNKQDRHKETQLDLLNFGILSILILEFLIVSVEYGARFGNFVIGFHFINVAIFLVSVSLILDGFSFRLTSGRWRFNPGKLRDGLFALPGLNSPNTSTTTTQGRDMTGLAIRVFTSKSNPYVGKQFPRKGICIKKVTINNNPNWYVLQLDQPIHLNNYLTHLFIIKPLGSKNSLDDDKIPIFFMFVPNEEILNQENIDIKSLRTAGKVFSRPINL